MHALFLYAGAMATYMKYPKGSIIHKVCFRQLRTITILFDFFPCICIIQVPKTIPAWQAAFIEPLSCSIHAVSLGDIQFDDIVVVSGCGPLGLGMVAAAKMKNPRKLIALDLLEWKVTIFFLRTCTL